MPVIVISGLTCVGSTTIGKKLSQKLGLKFFSLGNYLKSLSKGKETERATSIWKTEEGRSKNFHEKLDEMQQKLAKDGNIVINSKLGIKMLDADFKVWLKADKDVRAKRCAGRDNISFDEALRLLEQKEDFEINEWKKIYGFDFRDQEQKADLVIDTSDKNPDETVEIIIHELKRRRII